MMVKGNIEGIRETLLKQIETLAEITADSDTFAPPELLRALAQYTARINREICVYLTRGGEVVDISIGSDTSVALQRIHLRRSLDRLSGVRCIHTHPGGDAQLSTVDINSLRSLKFDAMASLGVQDDGKITGLCVAFLDAPDESGQFPVFMTRPYLLHRIPQEDLMHRIAEADRRIAAAKPPLENEVERALLVGIAPADDDPSLLELERLAETAGALVVGRVHQNLARVDSATYIGHGKAQEVGLMAQALDADIVIFDDELSGAQVRNLEESMPCKVVDRTALILDIFAQRATSREGKLQVELAQMRYRLPRLTGLGVVMSRLGAGIGTRGPGESKLEVDRRRIRRRITDIEKELQELTRQRELRRERRQRNEVPVVALVGYTNSGKSTLLNLLSDAGVLAEDKLFATLDPITRRIKLPGGANCLIVDTVGFISKLPHDLIRAFRSTLEEAMSADVLVIVQDVADDNFARQQEVVLEVLGELGGGDKPKLFALNKADLKPGLQLEKDDHALISAKENQGIERLLLLIEEKLMALSVEQEYFVPYARGDVAAFIHKVGNVAGESYEDLGTRFTARVGTADHERILKMLEKA